jgi:integrase
LIDCFGELPLDKITVDTVESFIAAKLGEDEPLSPRSINMMLTLLAAILDSARERKMIEANPATGKRRRVRERKPQRSYLDSAAGIKALLDAAATLGAKARDNGREGHVHREALTTVLVFAGLRVSELCDLLWRHVDLAVGWLAIKPVDVDPDAYVFATSRVEGMNVSFVQAYTVPRTLPRAGQERVRGAFSASDPLW